MLAYYVLLSPNIKYKKILDFYVYSHRLKYTYYVLSTE